jgi:hypothetical protein
MDTSVSTGGTRLFLFEQLTGRFPQNQASLGANHFPNLLAVFVGQFIRPRSGSILLSAIAEMAVPASSSLTLTDEEKARLQSLAHRVRS